MSVPYEQTGRRNQKARTREALVAATQRLLGSGVEPTVEDVAEEAKVSRTTAYRYFPDRQSLLLATHPEIQDGSLLPPDPPADPDARLEMLMRAFIGLTLESEPQLRAALRASLQRGAEQPELRGAPAIGWIAEALAPLRTDRPDVDVDRLATVMRSATGIESLVWLTDVAGIGRAEAGAVMTWTARAMLAAALAGDPPP